MKPGPSRNACIPTQHLPLSATTIEQGWRPWNRRPIRLTPLPSAHAKWIELKTSPIGEGNEQPNIRGMLRHKAIKAWTPMQKPGWKRCQPRW